MSKTISSVIICKRERDKFAWDGIGPLLEESRIGKIRRWREGEKEGLIQEGLVQEGPVRINKSSEQEMTTLRSKEDPLLDMSCFLNKLV